MIKSKNNNFIFRYEDFDEHQRWQYCYNYSKDRLYYQKERTIEEFECFG
jgi:hypothetical protein